MTVERHDNLLTIGQLGRRVGLRPSALRFYEAEGLLQPQAHSAAGYRLYGEKAETTLRFIQRAQRLGFALADIRALLRQQGTPIDDGTVERIARERLLALERQLTPLLVQRHELGLVLRQLQDQRAGGPALSRMLDQVCVDPRALTAGAMLEQLLAETGCALSGEEGRVLLAGLRGRHVHVWQEGEEYHILVVGNDPEVGTALERLARLEADCSATRSDQLPELQRSSEGHLLIARGAHAFLFARLFLALEQEAP